MMSGTQATGRHWFAAFFLMSCAGGTLLAGCHQEVQHGAVADTGGLSAATSSDDDGIALTPAEVARLGIETTVLVATAHAAQATGVGVVVSHEVIAQGIADLATAVAVEKQSRAAFERSRGLAKTTGALPLDVLETAQRQATVDRAALELEERRLSSFYGQDPPWKSDPSSRDLTALANGRSKLIRITFPMGTKLDGKPEYLRFAHLSGVVNAGNFRAASVWSAPADASVPGRSFFALLQEGDFGEGERVMAFATLAESENGVTIPSGAVVIASGRYWYYCEEKPGVFVRKELDTHASDADGYFVTAGAAAGEKVVTTAAGQLLARDLNAGKDSE